MAQLQQLPTELLVNILGWLPQKDLLLLQRTCRTWHSLINASPSLQARLFFRPYQHSTDDPNDAEFNPILYERFPDFFNDRMSMDALGPWRNTHWYRTAESQLLKKKKKTKKPKPERRYKVLGSMFGRKRPEPYFMFPGRPDPATISNSPYRHPEASWRRMILCHPAPTEYQFTFHYSTRAGKKHWKYRSVTKDHTISHPQPFLTFGCLHDIVERMWFHQGYFPIPEDMNLDYGPLTTVRDYMGKCQKPPLWIPTYRQLKEAKALRRAAEEAVEEDEDKDEDEDEDEVDDQNEERYERPIDNPGIHYMRYSERQKIFPEANFHRLGCVLVDLSLTWGCGSYPPHPDFFKAVTKEFHAENLPEPQFDVVLSAPEEQ